MAKLDPEILLACRKDTDSKEDTPAILSASWEAKKPAFIRHYNMTGNVRLSCEAVGIGRKTHYRWMEKDPEYREAVELAGQDAADRIEAALYERGVEGIEKPAGWYKGEPGGYIREYSDTAAIFLLKGLRPQKYAAHQVSKSTSLNFSVDLKTLPDSVISQLRSGVDYQTAVATWVAQLRADGQPVPVGLLGDGGD